jgi:hypothetical protein
MHIGAVGATLIGFRVSKDVDKTLWVGAQVFYTGGSHFRAAAPATGPGKKQECAVAQADQGIIASGQQRLQWLAGEGGFFSCAYAAPGIRCTGAC